MQRHIVVQYDPDSPRPPREREFYEDGVRKVARILEGVPWALTGTLATALRGERLWRAHSDIDVVVPEDALGLLCERIGGSGWGVFDRRYKARLCEQDTVLYVFEESDAAARRMRLFNPSEEGLARIVDVFPYRISQGRVHSREAGASVALGPAFIKGEVILPGGARVPAAHPVYVEEFKRHYSSGKYRFDGYFAARACGL